MVLISGASSPSKSRGFRSLNNAAPRAFIITFLEGCHRTPSYASYSSRNNQQILVEGSKLYKPEPDVLNRPETIADLAKSPTCRALSISSFGLEGVVSNERLLRTSRVFRKLKNRAGNFGVLHVRADRFSGPVLRRVAVKVP
jgi:hypothetical protein